MNLIEQLGGYECAKAEYKDPMYKDDELYTIKATGTRFFKHNLADELLEYRRQHNIYEAGDLVVMVDADDYSAIFKVIGKPQRLYHLQGNDDLFYGRLDFQIRHATDAEIEAGKRLEVG